ncbi:PIN domain-containing protein [Bradyrhizobium septentrionale]|uniref:PIN domain-containing protein n=2 Tax=Bradyrhizobium septentrionale TaxID=1404411 RepID=A0A973W4R7_9BRAD|nr:PIN domain-containing protein [Bradyrhizobium septentrionale]UGY16270.1 PIN domain-containing protein [Bradyrhizobium septentrionale]
MFANRFTALVDACSLASVLKRNLLLSLAEADFFRLRWSEKILDETQKAVEQIYAKRGHPDAADRAQRARKNMEAAFEDAKVENYDHLLPLGDALPDRGDKHVLAAAVKTQASMIVTENLRHFPSDILSDLNIEAKSADSFIADTIALDPGRAVAAIRKMRLRFKRPEKTAEALLLDMEAAGLIEAVDLLREHVESL